jgi:putative inorganic carbon (hco3(-)) transporter
MGKDFQLPVIPLSPEATLRSKSGWRRSVLLEKLNSPAGYILLFLFSAALALGVGFFGFKFGLVALVAMVAIPATYALVVYPRIGITLYILLAWFLLYIMKIGVDFPMGTVMDALEVLFFLGLFIQQRQKKDWSMFKGPVTNMILIWIVYNLAEVANPAAESRMAWLFAVRSFALIMVMYFVFLYNIKTIEFVRFLLKLWLGLALFAALYAWKQQFIGFTGFEEAYLHSDPRIADLLFIGGMWRKFSIFSDPVVFSYTMVFSSLLCIGMLTGPVSRRRKLILLLLIFAYTTAMLFSGTRGAYVLMPAAMLLYMILKFNTRILFIGLAGAVLLVALILVPTSNGALYRFQSAFKPSEDESYNVRKQNQKMIQPYIQTHPIGGGLGSTQVFGSRFAPNSFLAHFPPDSGYVRVAVELGWVGLFLMCALMFVVLRAAINNYYIIRDPEIKSYSFAMVLILFAFHIGNFPQEALVQFPSNVNFYLVIALVNVLLRIDQQKNLIPHAAR